MEYVGSYIWKLRQRVGDITLLTSTVDILAVDLENKICLIQAKGRDYWSLPGGHVELGDSFASAAAKELAEEAGLIAKKSDLIPFATIAGPKRIFEYPDGKTQPLTMVFLTKKWQEDNSQIDGEVVESQWIEIDQALGMGINDATRKIILSYQKYQQTNEFQMIEEF